MGNAVITTLQCGDYKCRREAKWVWADFDLSNSNDGGSRAVRCGVHGPGPQKRVRYGYGTPYVSLSERPDVVEAAVKYRLAEAKRQRKSEQEAADKERERQLKIIDQDWKEVEPDYEIDYVERIDWGYSEDSPHRIWNIWASTDQRHDDYGAHIQIEITGGGDRYGAPVPFGIRARNGSQPGPNLARALAETYINAANMVEALNSAQELAYQQWKEEQS